MIVLPIYIYIYILIFISAMIAKNSSGSWFSPGAFFSMMWLFFIITLSFFASEFLINYHGIWFISLFVVACSSGSVAATIALPEKILKSIKDDLYLDRLIFQF